MPAVHILFNNVFFSYGSSVPLFENLTFDSAPGWTGLVGENGSGKTTLCLLAAGLLEPRSGVIRRPDTAFYCAQRTDLVPDGLDSLLNATDHEARRLRGLLNLESDFSGRWNTLSHGERKKAQAAVALWRLPGALILDEPTNHLDASSLDMLLPALRAFTGVGMIVSHDRFFLDTLCYQCLFLNPPRAIMRPGGFSRGWEAEYNEKENAARKRDLLKKEAARLERETVRRRNLKAKKPNARSVIKTADDADARFKRRMARLTGKDAVGGKLSSQLSGRLRHIEEEINDLSPVKTHVSGIFISASRSRRPFLFALAEETIEFGNGCGLVHPDLSMRPADRVTLIGPNGAGKSTMVERVISGLTLPPERVVYVPQEITLEESRRLLTEILSMTAGERGLLLSLVSRLGSRPVRLFATGDPSPGETRKLLLARGILREPHLIIMDEPTNHLDAVAVQSLADALSACPCGLLLVSHDRRFLEELTTVRWEIGEEEEGKYRLRVR